MSPQPHFEPAIAFPKPFGKNEAQEGTDGNILHPPKRIGLPLPPNLLTSE